MQQQQNKLDKKSVMGKVPLTPNASALATQVALLSITWHNYHLFHAKIAHLPGQEVRKLYIFT